MVFSEDSCQAETFHRRPVLKIQSEKINLQESSKGISIDSERPENLLIEHCRIKGSIQVGDPDRAGSNPAPTKILFDRLIMDGFSEDSCQAETFHRLSGDHLHSVAKKNPSENSENSENSKNSENSFTKALFHLMEGVSHVSLMNSVIKGSVCGLNIRLAPGSSHNVIKNNSIKARSQKRELISVEGSSHNIIVNNYFSALEGGGVYLSCKTGNMPVLVENPPIPPIEKNGKFKRNRPINKHSESTDNLIANNVFDYKHLSSGDNLSPSVKLSPKNCESGQVSHNAITHNQIMGETIVEPDPKDVEKTLFEKYLFHNNDPNLFYENKIVNEVSVYGKPVCRSLYAYPAVGFSKYGYGSQSSHVCPVCYASGGFPKRLILNGDDLKFVLDKKGFSFSMGRVRTCENAILKETGEPVLFEKSENYKIHEDFFELTKDHPVEQFYCPNKEKLLAVRVFCNLKGHPVTGKDLLSIDWNSIKRLKNPGEQGLCRLFERVRGTDHKIFLTGSLDSDHILFEFKYFERSGLGIECKKQNKTNDNACYIGVQYLCSPPDKEFL